MSKGYVIHVGSHAPQKVIVAVPDKKTGNPTGDVFEVFKQTGVYQIINRTRPWARRVLPGGKPLTDASGNEVPLEVDDQRYKGDLEFLEWGDFKTGAQGIDIRYLPQSSTLDYEFQRIRMKIETVPEDGSAFISLTPGENVFDYKTQSLLINLLKAHGQNRDSKSKNPDPLIKGYTFYEVGEKSSDKGFVSAKEKSLDAGLLIKQLSTKPAQLTNLLDVILLSNAESENPLFMTISTLHSQTDIYKTLLLFSEQSTDRLMSHIEGFRNKIIDRLNYAESFKAIDESKAGVVAMVVDAKPQIIFSNIPEKNMRKWIIDNCFDDVVYGGLKKIFAICDKLK